MFLFIVALSDYYDLIQAAKNNANVKKLQAIKKLHDLKPTTYSENGYEYTIRYGVTGDLSEDILGFAKDKSHIALFEKENADSKVNKVFTNSEKQKMYMLTELVETQDNVKVYKFQKVDALDLISNIKYVSEADPAFSKEVSTSYKWNPNGEPFTAGRPENAYANDHLKIGAGAYARARITVNIDIVMRSLSLTATLNTKAIVGAQVVIDGYRYTLPQLKVYSGTYNIPNSLSFKIFGIGVGLTTDLFADITINAIDLNIPIHIEWYRGYIVEAEKSVSVTTSKGFIDGPVKFSVTPVKSGTTIEEALKQIFSCTFEMTPTVDMGVVIALTAGKVKYLETKIHIIPYVPIKFGFDQEECASPFLYGSMQPKLDLRFTFSGFRYHDITIIKDYDHTWNLWTCRPLMMCLADPFTSEERGSSRSYSSDLTSYVINPSLSISGYTFTHPQHIVEIQAVTNDNKVLAQTAIKWQQIPKEPSRLNTGRYLIVPNAPSDFFWRFKARQMTNYLVFDSYTNMKRDVKPASDLLNLNYVGIKEDDKASKSAMIEVYHNAKAGRTVKLGKEYRVSADDKFIAFEATYDGNWAILTRKKGEQYKLSKNHYFTNAMAAEYDRYNNFDYVAEKSGSYMEISLHKLVVKKAIGKKGILLNFNRAIKNLAYNSGAFTLGKIGGDDQIQNTPVGTYSAADLGVSSWNFLYHSIPDSTLECQVSIDGSDYKTVFAKHELLKSGSVLNFPYEAVDIYFSIKPVNPIIFADIPADTRSAIPIYIHDVTSRKGIFTPYDNLFEKIGDYVGIKNTLNILTSANIPTSGKQTVYVPVYADGFTPLTEHEVIDENLFIVKLTPDMFTFGNSIEYAITFKVNKKGILKRKIHVFDPFATDNVGSFAYQINSKFQTTFQPGIISNSNAKFTSIHTTPTSSNTYKAKDVELGNGWHVHYASFYLGSEVSFVQTSFEISDKIASINFELPQYDASILEKVHFDFTCNRAKEASVYDGNGQKLREFPLTIALYGTDPGAIYTVIPICSSPNSAFCSIPIKIKPFVHTFLSYSDADGIHAYNDKYFNFGTGVIGEQIASLYEDEKIVNVWKTWEGEIKVTTPNEDFYPLTIVRDIDAQGNITFKAMMDGKILYASQKYVSDNFEKAINALGVAGRVPFASITNKDFSISFPRSDFSPATPSNQCTDFEPIFGLLPQTCTSIKFTINDGSVSYNDVDTQNSEESYMDTAKPWMIITIVGAILLAAIIIVVGIVLLRRKPKKYEISQLTESLVQPMLI